MSRLIIFTHPMLRNALTFRERICQIPDGYMSVFKENTYENVKLRNDILACSELADLLPIVAIFSYIFQTGIPEGNVATVRKSDVYKFLGITRGDNGYRLFDKLKELQGVYAEVNGAWRPVVRIIEDRGRYIDVDCAYLKFIVAKIPRAESCLYYTKNVDARILKERSRLAILITIELAKLVTTTGLGGTPNISVERLTEYIPELKDIVDSIDSVGVKNQKLKRAFTKAYELISDNKIVHIDSCSLKEAPIPRLCEFDGKLKYREKYVIRFTKKEKGFDENDQSMEKGFESSHTKNPK